MDLITNIDLQLAYLKADSQKYAKKLSAHAGEPKYKPLADKTAKIFKQIKKLEKLRLQVKGIRR